MPGLIGSIFTPDQEDSTQSNATEIGSEGGIGVDLSPSITLESGGSYDDLDGSTTTWSNTTTVGLNVDIQLDHAVSLGLDETTVG